MPCRRRPLSAHCGWHLPRELACPTSCSDGAHRWGNTSQCSIHIVEKSSLSRRHAAWAACLGLVGGGVLTEGVEVDVWFALHTYARHMSQLPSLHNCDTVP
eukprot:8857590-Pyramimonas_sp.AAC.1